MAEEMLGDRYQFCSMIGSGAFGRVYLGHDTKTGGDVAIKVETVTGGKKSLRREYKAYQMLASSQVAPQPLYFGLHEGASALVLELLGPSLEDLFQYCGGRFSLKTVLELADQLLDCLQTLHEYGIVHRDIKPDNFMIGMGSKASTVFLGDFGLAGVWKDQNSKHIPKKITPGVIGTVRYMSLNCHWGIQPSRRDDLESLGYMLVYFLKGSLPWQDIRGPTSASIERQVLNRKLSLTVDDLCQDCPSEISTLINDCRHLRFEEEPPYEAVRDSLNGLFTANGYEYDSFYDWTLKSTETNDSLDKDSSGERSTAASTLEGSTDESQEQSHRVSGIANWISDSGVLIPC